MKDNAAFKLRNIGRGIPAWARMVIRLPFLLLFIYEGCRSFLDGGRRCGASPCQSVSVIIPTLNEEKNVVLCIRAVLKNRHVREVVVVDAGSNDRTRELAKQAGARVIIHDRPVEDGGGRGGQIKAGINAAGGDVVMIVHADTILPAAEIDRVISVLNQHPGVIGGSVGCRFDSLRSRFRIVALANDVRAAFLKISFGDQVQFFRRQSVVSRNLFPDIPLMEDVEFSIRLLRLGRTIHLFGNALVSTRRWETVGSRNASWIIRQVAAYLLRRLWSEPDTVALYGKYYNRG